MSSTETGNDAEAKVAEFLKLKGHKILSLNWRNRWCEIDVISKFKDTVYFTEVKFRKNDFWGDGFQYITNTKLKQMKFAADFWLSDNNWNGEAILQAAAVDGKYNIELVEIN